MTERRPHWDDDLIDAVRDAVDVEFDDIWKLSEDSIRAVIAAVEDWARWEHVPKGTLLRLERAEAAIQRVRERAGGPTPAVHGDWMAGYALAMRDVLCALDGGAECSVCGRTRGADRPSSWYAAVDWDGNFHAFCPECFETLDAAE